MVDSISGAGASQNLSQVKANQTQRSERSGSTNGASESSDVVDVSSEAQELADVDALTAQIRGQLAEGTESLSNGQNLDILL